MNETKVYESAVDPWFYPVLLIVPWAVTALAVFLTAHTLHGVWIGGVLGLVVLAVVAPFTRPCRYTFSDERLHIRSGFLQIEILLADIENAECVRSFIAAPCLSIHRVLITAGKTKEMVSPVDRDAFITDLIGRVRTKKTGVGLGV